MKLTIKSTLEYEVTAPAVYFFALRCIPTGGQQILSEKLTSVPAVPFEEFTLEMGMNRFTKVQIDGPGLVKIDYEAEVETSCLLADIGTLAGEGTGALELDAIPYLFPSRYCQSDQLREKAAELFGGSVGKYRTALAISDWVFKNVAYKPGSSNESTSAAETFESRAGVCRDFAHLTVALCRAMNIPARYVSVYANQLQPEDFHAVTEVCISGTWYVLDSTRLAPLDGMVRIATGRDAADVSIATAFGGSSFKSSKVSCVASGDSRPQITHDSLAAAGQALAL